jgi:hypothetical protein
VVTEGCPVGAALAEQVLERSERDLRSGAEPDAVGISYLPLLLPRGEPSHTPAIVSRPHLLPLARAGCHVVAASAEAG